MSTMKNWVLILCLHFFSSFSHSGERAMSPAQSEDSGLAADRGTTYATISLPRENAQAMGIVFLGRFIFHLILFINLKKDI